MEAGAQVALAARRISVQPLARARQPAATRVPALRTSALRAQQAPLTVPASVLCMHLPTARLLHADPAAQRPSPLLLACSCISKCGSISHTTTALHSRPALSMSHAHTGGSWCQPLLPLLLVCALTWAA